MPQTRMHQRGGVVDLRTESAPFCFNCGYDLTGLELPRPCPECGTPADPQADIEAARRWFASLGFRPWRVLRRSRIPIALWYGLDDPQSRRTARRRFMLGMILPSLLTTVVVMTSNTFVSESMAWMEWGMPGGPPLAKVDASIERRPFQPTTGGYVRPYDFGPPGGSDCVIVDEDIWTPWEFVIPDRVHEATIRYAVIPWIATLFSFVTNSAALAAVIARRQHRTRRTSADVATSVLVPMYAAVLWLWFLVTVVVCVFHACRMEPPLIGSHPPFGVWSVLIVLWGVASLTGWPALVGCEPARVVVRHPCWVSVLLAGLAVAGPLAVYVGMARIFN